MNKQVGKNLALDANDIISYEKPMEEHPTDKVEMNKNRFVKLLYNIFRSRSGIPSLIAWLEDISFFEDPASSKHHGAYRGGLCEHSLAVYDVLMGLFEWTRAAGLIEVDNKHINEYLDSITISALLHDVCKAGTYQIAYRNQKVDGVWTKVPYYTYKDDELPMGHGEKSVYIINQFFPLSRDEALAIRWHMGAYEGEKHYMDIERAQMKSPLVTMLHFADVWATRYIA